ncbi:putative late blight resistance protein homolog R1B-23 [Lycium ferocissimum]|uniref:putative late blight resistance protein homolog R1B-23 n=1 Tax=Lycium ferocissimum TaxID=112874 RepID=UPI002814B0E7|nr:putative late blight resistance protein homolog R1B-23 [Lycium ferocissimum]
MPEVIQKVQNLFQDVAIDLGKVGPDFDLIFSQKHGVANPIFVTEFIDNVVENLSDILKICDSHSPLFVPGSKTHIEEVLKELNLLKTFVFTHVLVLAVHAAIIPWLYLPCHVNGDQDSAIDEMNRLLSELLRMRIKPFQPCIPKIYVEIRQALKSTQSRWYPIIQIEYVADCEASFIKSLLHNLEEISTISTPSRIVAIKDQMGTLQEMLNLLRVNHLPLLAQDLIFHIQDIGTVIADVGLLVYSLYDNEEEKEDMALEDFDFPSNIERIKAVIYLIIRKPFQSNLPRIHGLGLCRLSFKQPEGVPRPMRTFT